MTTLPVNTDVTLALLVRIPDVIGKAKLIMTGVKGELIPDPLSLKGLHGLSQVLLVRDCPAGASRTIGHARANQNAYGMTDHLGKPSWLLAF